MCFARFGNDHNCKEQFSNWISTSYQFEYNASTPDNHTLNLMSDCIQSIGLKNGHLSHISQKKEILPKPCNTYQNTINIHHLIYFILCIPLKYVELSVVDTIPILFRILISLLLWLCLLSKCIRFYSQSLLEIVTHKQINFVVNSITVNNLVSDISSICEH